METIRPEQNGQHDIGKVQEQTWNFKWDMVKVQEPNGLDPQADEQHKKSILALLSEGFEPFSVVPFMGRKSNFDTSPVVTNWIYFKRPSTIVEKIDDSPRVLR